LRRAIIQAALGLRFFMDYQRILMQPDTRRLLRTGLAIFGTGVISVLLLFEVFGGITHRQGPHTNMGWLALMLAMGCLPTGFLTLLLAAVKLLGDRLR
jgi:hypothetical protein